MDKEVEKNSWWNPQNYLQNINLTGAIDAIWDGVIVGDSKFNPEKSCYELADEYKHSGRSIESSAENFIQWQTAKAGAIGFLLGAPGFISLAAAIPGDFLACTYLQMRAVAVIAILCGWDVKSDRVKTLALYSMAGGGFTASTTKMAGTASAKGANVVLKALPGASLIALNKVLGFRFITKYGAQGVINLVDFIPLVGGLVSGAVNALLTYQAGQIAYSVLKNGPDDDIVLDVEPFDS